MNNSWQSSLSYRNQVATLIPLQFHCQGSFGSWANLHHRSRTPARPIAAGQGKRCDEGPWQTSQNPLSYLPSPEQLAVWSFLRTRRFFCRISIDKTNGRIVAAEKNIFPYISIYIYTYIFIRIYLYLIPARQRSAPIILGSPNGFAVQNPAAVTGLCWGISELPAGSELIQADSITRNLSV